MKHRTVIDTLAMRVDFINNEDKRNDVMAELIALVERYEFDYEPVTDDDGYDKKEYLIKYKFYKTVASLTWGSYSYKSKNKDKEEKVSYLSIKFAGLKRYNPSIDLASMNCLLIMCSYLNTNKHNFKVTQLDWSLDIFTRFPFVLALCNNKIPRRLYYKVNEEQPFETTRYIEKFASKQKQKDATIRACLYDKTEKHNLPFKLTRFELSFQKNFFKKHDFNIGLMYSEFNRYHILYIPNQKKKQEVMDKYDSKVVIRQKDVKELRMEGYRLFPDINVLIDFVNSIYTVNDDILGSFLLKSSCK